MGANMNVTYDDMHTAASGLTKGQENIENMLRQLKSSIDSLVNGGYVTDRSSKAFESSYTEFNTGVSQTINGLEGMAKFLHGAADQLAQTDQALASTLSKG